MRGTDRMLEDEELGWTAPGGASPLDLALLDAALEAFGEPMLFVDTGLRVLRWSPAFETQAGAVTGGGLAAGRSLESALEPGEWRTALVESFIAALAGTPSRRSAWAEGAGRRRRQQDQRFVPVRDGQGRIVGALMMARESHPAATEGKEDRHRVAFEHSPFGTALAAPDGTILECNAAFAHLLGAAPERVIGRTMRDITHPEDRGNSPFMALVRGNISHYAVDKRYMRDDGRVIKVHATAVRLPGDPLVVLAVVHENEGNGGAALLDAGWHRVMFEAQSQPAALLAADGRVVLANQALARLTGLALERIIGHPGSDLIAFEDPGMLAARLAEARTGPLCFETSLHRAGLSSLPVDLSLAPVTGGGETRFCCLVRDLSARHQLETARQASELRYKGLVQRAPVITYSFSTVRGGLYYSPQVEAVLGYTPLEMVDHPFRWFESIHPEDLPRVRAELDGLGRKGGFDVELRLRHKDGSWRWLREWSSSVDRVGDELVVVGQALDLTPLREQERRFQRLVENVPDILFRWSRNPTPHFNYISAAVERVFGHTQEEFLADPDLFHRCLDAGDRAKALAFRADPSMDRHSYRIRGHHRDGRPVVLDVNRSVIRDQEGAVIAVEGVARDVTAAVGAERRNALLSAGLEQAVEVVLITDREGHIIEANAAFEKVTGYTRDEVLGKRPSILKSGFQGDDFYARMWQTLTAGQIFRGTMINRKRDGANYVAEAVITPIRDAAGEIVNYVGLQRDVSRERLLDEALRQAQKMEAVGQVTGGVAHDFNNMLTVILANANLLEGQLAPGSEAAATLREMIAAAQHGTGLVRQLLAYGRKEHLSPRPIRLTDEFSSFVTILRRALSENIEIAFAGADASWAEVDHTAFEQMLLNLATNARDAMPEGGRITIRTASRTITDSEAATSAGARQPGAYTTISVTDTGKGMPPEVVSRVFEPFFTTKGVGKGTGLGMAMVYGLMQQHGGWVEIESALGVGTTVTLAFPVVPAPHLAAAQPEAAAPEGRPGRGELILIVEDEDALRRVAARTLEREGYEVIAASDGEAAWAQWHEHGEAIALILTDAVMPKLGGPELIRRLRAEGCAVPVILMSGYSAEDLSDPRLKDVPVVAKPWNGVALGRRIREVLDAGADRGPSAGG